MDVNGIWELFTIRFTHPPALAEIVRQEGFLLPRCWLRLVRLQGAPDLIRQEEVAWEALTSNQMIACIEIEVLSVVSGSYINHLARHSSGSGSEEAQEEQEDEMEKIHFGCMQSVCILLGSVSTTRGKGLTKVLML